MELLITFIIAFWLGAKLSTVWNRIVFRDILRDLGVTDKDLRKLALAKGLQVTEDQPKEAENQPDEVTIKIEQHGQSLYAFRIENDEFLGQGNSREELVDRLAKRFKNTKFTVPHDMGADLLKNDA